MSFRRNRRAVMAELLLLADPLTIRTRLDGVSMAIDFDTIAELRSWLTRAGLTGSEILTAEYNDTDEDGRPYRAMNAYPTWHGWKIYAAAIEYTDPRSPLGPQTADQLAALAVTP